LVERSQETRDYLSGKKEEGQTPIPFPFLQSFFDERAKGSKRVVFDRRDFLDLSQNLKDQISFKNNYQDQARTLLQTESAVEVADFRRKLQDELMN
jgi:hypothetical protein